MWKCPNGCEIEHVLVCGGNSIPDNPDSPNIYFLATLEGEYTNMFYDGSIGVPQECYDHADAGCAMEPQCPECLEYAVEC